MLRVHRDKSRAGMLEVEFDLSSNARAPWVRTCALA
jgi:hypothetical protein